MPKRRLTLAVLAVLGLVALPVPEASAQEEPSTPDIDIKEEIKTPVVSDGMDGSAAAGVTTFGAPPAPPGSNVQVSQDQDPAANFRSGASEVSIAMSQLGRRGVAGWNDGEGFGFAPFTPGEPPLGLSGYGFTANGGASWTDGGAPPIGNTVAFGPGPQGRSETGNYVTRGDPWLDADSAPGRETWYYANLAVWEDDAETPPAGISIHKGSFRGRNFSWNESVLVQSPNYPNDFLDKEALAVDGRGRNTAVYVTTTNFEEVCDTPFFGFGTIELYRSLDAGTSWDRTVIQPDETFITDPADPDCGADGIVNQGSAPAVGPNGELYVAWERGWFAPASGGAELDRATIAFSASTDQGASFTAPAQVASICSMAQDEPAAYNRTSTNDFPRIAVAKSGLHKGRIYITYQDCSAAHGDAPFGADTDVYVTFSDDGGATWSTPTAVHQVADGTQQFWPVVSVDQFGIVDVTYYGMDAVNVTPDPDDIECRVRIGGPLDDPDFKESTLTTFSDYFRVRSFTGGQSWTSPQRLSDTTTNWCAATPVNSIIPNFGDYNDHRSTLLRVYAVWADGRNAGLLDRVPTVWFARR